MDRFEALRTFVAVADHRSFAEAARRLRISPTAASRAIADLEKTLGVTLLRRTTRSVGLTPEGASYLERCRIALNELDDAERSLRGENAEPRGELIVTAPVVFGRMHILPIVTKLLRAHRQLDVHLILVDRVIRLVEEGIDVAVRIADLSDSSLHAIRVAEVRRVLVASPAYLAERDVPAQVSDLLKHDLIAFDSFALNSEWRFTKSGRPAIRCEPRLLIDAALDGLGIARALSYQVDAHVRAGRLRYVLPEFDPPGVPVSLLFQASRRGSPNVQALIAAAQEYFRSGKITYSANFASSA
jgi:DNA-binding transcriptional LysR family regulator